ncbi:nucleotidyltransferase family protein [Sphingobium phenoxybenzoativorans]|uniref:Nucleotidyltransferase family protein n=1 Tax=Sphingobium phenoxybenzoativorans TaxID=1592790 RepID=A0A975K659_9SPHN|nr:nucleotidyltransferase family protein [Sphingobium phenoxybenzoativorans]QUT04803.1 nucleotidyltransferase family protein [Sphingobium phenoxybenzoativorans]
MDGPRRIAAILLAAGRSERFGPDDKLLAVLQGRPLMAHAAAMLAGMEFGALMAICAAGGETPDVARAEGFAVVHPSRPSAGMAHSIAMAIRAASQLPEIDAALICLADMPFVSGDHIRRIIDAHDRDNFPVVASSDGKAAMPPALFGREHFAQLQDLRGGAGAKALLQSAHLIYADPVTLVDIDRIEDLGG